MARYPELSEEQYALVSSLVACARKTGHETFGLLVAYGPEVTLIGAETCAGLESPPWQVEAYEVLDRLGLLLVRRGELDSITLMPLAYAYARHMSRPGWRRWLSDRWYEANLDKPLWVRSVHGLLTFTLAAAATGAGFVVGLWLARLVGLPIS